MVRTFSRRGFAKSLVTIAAVSPLLLANAGTVHSAALAKPEGKVVLTITGRITETNADGAAEFDLAMLEAIGMKSFTTTTPWFDGPVTFEGVPMATLLNRAVTSLRCSMSKARRFALTCSKRSCCEMV